MDKKIILPALIFGFIISFHLLEYSYPCDFDPNERCDYWVLHYVKDVQHFGFDFDFRYAGESEIFVKHNDMFLFRRLIVLPDEVNQRIIDKGEPIGSYVAEGEEVGTETKNN